MEIHGYSLTAAMHRELLELQPWQRRDLAGRTLIVGYDGDLTKRDELQAIQDSYREARLEVLAEGRFWFAKVYQDPEPLYSATLDWLAEGEDAPTPAACAAPSPPVARRHDEAPVCFGEPGERMFGVVHTPPRPRGPVRAVILFHGGRQARRGPHRMYVKTARRLSEAGFTCCATTTAATATAKARSSARSGSGWPTRSPPPTSSGSTSTSSSCGAGRCAWALSSPRMRRPSAPVRSTGFVFCNALFDRDYVSGNGTPKRLPRRRPPCRRPPYRCGGASPARRSGKRGGCAAGSRAF